MAPEERVVAQGAPVAAVAEPDKCSCWGWSAPCAAAEAVDPPAAAGRRSRRWSWAAVAGLTFAPSPRRGGGAVTREKISIT